MKKFIKPSYFKFINRIQKTSDDHGRNDYDCCPALPIPLRMSGIDGVCCPERPGITGWNLAPLCTASAGVVSGYFAGQAIYGLGGAFATIIPLICMPLPRAAQDSYVTCYWQPRLQTEIRKINAEVKALPKLQQKSLRQLRGLLHPTQRETNILFALPPPNFPSVSPVSIFAGSASALQAPHPFALSSETFNVRF